MVSRMLASRSGRYVIGGITVAALAYGLYCLYPWSKNDESAQVSPPRSDKDSLEVSSDSADDETSSRGSTGTADERTLQEQQSPRVEDDDIFLDPIDVADDELEEQHQEDQVPAQLEEQHQEDQVPAQLEEQRQEDQVPAQLEEQHQEDQAPAQLEEQHQEDQVPAQLEGQHQEDQAQAQQEEQSPRQQEAFEALGQDAQKVVSSINDLVVRGKNMLSQEETYVRHIVSLYDTFLAEVTPLDGQQSATQADYLLSKLDGLLFAYDQFIDEHISHSAQQNRAIHLKMLLRCAQVCKGNIDALKHARGTTVVHNMDGDNIPVSTSRRNEMHGYLEQYRDYLAVFLQIE